MLRNIANTLLVALTISGCGQRPSNTEVSNAKVPAAQDSQEGIGGDVAAIYMKGLANYALRQVPMKDVTPDIERQLRETKLYSSEGLNALFERSGNIVLVDRMKLDTMAPLEAAIQYLTFLGFPAIAGKITRDIPLFLAFSGTSDLEGWHKTAKEFMKKTPHWPHSGSGGDLISDTPYTYALLFDELLDVFSRVTFVATNKKLVDEETKREVDAVTVMNFRLGHKILVNVFRILRLPTLSRYAPLVLVHEANHAATPNLKQYDLQYNFSGPLFDEWVKNEF